MLISLCSSPYVILAHYGELDWVSQISGLSISRRNANACSAHLGG
jgi:hypothetical protein